MLPIISVIVPAFNAEKYLERSINSILSSTLTELEIILVNDGSTDRTAEICMELKKKDSRVLVVHQRNKGVSAARNAGLHLARGKYFAFVDADDYIEVDMYEKMVEALKRNGAEMSCCRMNFSERSLDRERAGTVQVVEDTDKILKKLLLPTKYGISTAACNKLGIVSIQKKYDIYFDEKIFECEDGLFWCRYISKIRKMVIVQEELYHYIKVADSVSNSAKVTEKKLTNFKAWEDIMHICSEFSTELENLAKARYHLYAIKMLFNAYLENGKKGVRNAIHQLQTYKGYFYNAKEIPLIKRMYWIICGWIVQYDLGIKTAKKWDELKRYLIDRNKNY